MKKLTYEEELAAEAMLRKEARNQIPRRNPEGYSDPTAYKALTPIQQQQDEADLRCQRLIKALKSMIDLSDYDLLARIEVRDRKTGRVYR